MFDYGILIAGNRIFEMFGSGVAGDTTLDMNKGTNFMVVVRMAEVVRK